MSRGRYAVLILAAGMSVAAMGMGGCANCPGTKSAEPAKPVRVVEAPRPEPVVVRTPTGPYSIELTPLTDVNPVQTQHVFVATVRDANGTPVPNVKVEWMLGNGPGLGGEIVDVDGGKKVDNSYAVSTTGSGNRTLDWGTSDTSDDIAMGAGQTWAVITSTVEGTSKMIAYAPAIQDWNRHKAFAEKNWMDVTWEWPADATNRAGTTHDFMVRVLRYSDGSPYAGYRVNYRLLGGPAGSLSTGSVMTDANGVARSTLSQASPARGTNDVEITIIRPARKDDCVCYPEKVIATGVVRKNWIIPDLAITKTAPPQVCVGDEFTYSITASNTSSDASLRDVVVTDPLPEGVEYVSSSPAASVAGSTLTWNLGEMAPSASQPLSVTVRAKRTGRFENCATMTAEGGSMSKRACAETMASAAAIKITKSATPTATICDPITYRIVVTNPGDCTASDVMVTDDLPNGVVARDGRTSFSWGPISLAPGQSQEFTIDAMAKSGGSYTNTARVTARGGLSDSASASTNVTECKLGITKSAARGDLKNGRPATFTITVSNTGSAEAVNVMVDDPIPAGMRFDSATDGGVSNGAVVTWNLGNLAPGASRSVSVTMSGATEGTYTNTATARANCCEPVSASAPVKYEGVPAVLLEVVDAPDPIEVGGITTYTIDVTNQGDAMDTNVRITCDLPAEQEFVSAEGARGVSHQVSGKTITFAPVPTIAPKERIQYRVTVKATGTGDVRFTTRMRTDKSARSSDVTETESTNIY
ncbi:MAG: hypothetical protein HMLKMBBP_03577 [Planctomycetes bacterium]|nr:hypothetical protein [Planctomycetota bacterium]